MTLKPSDSHNHGKWPSIKSILISHWLEKIGTVVYFWVEVTKMRIQIFSYLQILSSIMEHYNFIIHGTCRCKIQKKMKHIASMDWKVKGEVGEWKCGLQYKITFEDINEDFEKWKHCSLHMIIRYYNLTDKDIDRAVIKFSRCSNKISWISCFTELVSKSYNEGDGVRLMENPQLKHLKRTIWIASLVHQTKYQNRSEIYIVSL